MEKKLIEIKIVESNFNTTLLTTNKYNLVDFENDEIQLTCEKKTKQSTNKKKSISVKSKRSFDESGINSGSSRKLKHSDDI